MAKNTSITLGNYFLEIIQNSIETGRYSNVSEVIRAGLRMVDEKEKRIKILRKAIEDGEESGYLEEFNPKTHLEDLNNKYSK